MRRLRFNEITKFNGDFIGHASNSCTEFIYGDSPDIFQDNLTKMPADWYYRNKKLTYDLNEMGHRSRSIDKIDFNNYILFVGCSHTFGMGLELETTYPYLVSQMLNMDYYNLGLTGASMDVVFYNLVTWLTKFNKPKLIVFQKPEIARFVLLENNSWLNFVGPWTLTDENIKNFYNSALNIPYFETKTFLYFKLISSLCKDIPIINFELKFKGSKLKQNPHFDDFNIFNFIPDYDNLARDNMHFGITSQIKLANIIVEKYKTYE